ncbi:uncharacterized protein LOC123273242 [Cotesia glomerata]|uniref:Uncharacterized protein n=1 Tax=Cotesia glomerata TaxID=32391 RepID=A0AAV7J2B5_COTGL|nr:uncharacterized protein LOC123273242 [Cotesia glomerata]KAH0563975.1 hypothetical protein KQX54_008455 [Cotesia glomerata]
MVNSKCVVILLLTITISKGMPSPEDTTKKTDTKQDSLFGLPFLEFKNGGVRVNFAGYHAEAGLGGLLTGNGNGGGLFAGAGTPFGAHASAELGGSVNGNKGGNAGGGLHARAGLGNGGPEAAAGLGGNLDGSDGSKNGGVLYTATSNRGRTRIISKSIGGAPSGDVPSVPSVPNESNIQLISRNQKLSSNVQSDGLVRREIDSPEGVNIVEPLPVPAPVPQSAYAYANSRCRKKRRQICNRLTKTIIQQQLPLAQVPADFVQPELLTQPQPLPLDARSTKIVPQSSGTDVALAPGPAPAVASSIPAPAYGPARPKTLFDDIFNIPISTLHAVNQLLNSKVG